MIVGLVAFLVLLFLIPLDVHPDGRWHPDCPICAAAAALLGAAVAYVAIDLILLRRELLGDDARKSLLLGMFRPTSPRAPPLTF